MNKLRIGLAGLGSVGTGVVTLVETQARLRFGGALEITGVSARTRNKDRPVDVSAYAWFDDPVALAQSDNIDVFIELIGGEDGPAKLAIEAALEAGKHVVTGNKALIATHGGTLSTVAEKNNVNLLFEAAVAGGIPIVRTLKDSLAGTKVKRLLGILNGTCNYLTTEMLATDREYGDVLEDAKNLGYAEADPFLDVSGTDAAQKIAILAALTFSADLDMSKVIIEGVDNVSLSDLKLARQLGLNIKLIAGSEAREDGIVNRVEPIALNESHPLSNVNGTLNAVIVDSEGLGQITLIGHGAGTGPTASAVMGDVAKLFEPSVQEPFGRAAHHAKTKFLQPVESSTICALVLASIRDEPGALARITDALGQKKISVDRLVQNSANNSGMADIGIITHPAGRQHLSEAIRDINALGITTKIGKYFPVL